MRVGGIWPPKTNEWLRPWLDPFTPSGHAAVGSHHLHRPITHRHHEHFSITGPQNPNAKNINPWRLYVAPLCTFLLRVIAGLSSGRVCVGWCRQIGWCDWGEGWRFSTKQKLTKPTKIKLRNLSLIQSRSDPLEFN